MPSIRANGLDIAYDVKPTPSGGLLLTGKTANTSDQDAIYEIEEALKRANNGCKFAPRCPHVMEQCWGAPPPQYTPDAHRLATCFLYRDAPISPNPDVATVFRASDVPVGGPGQ